MDSSTAAEAASKDESPKQSISNQPDTDKSKVQGTLDQLIQSPSIQPSPSPSNSISSSPSKASSSGTNNTPSKWQVGETPKWRFVNKAKSTEGYTTLSAGKIVKGKSSQELVGFYSNRNISKSEIYMQDVESSGEILNPNNNNRERYSTGNIGRLDIKEQMNDTDTEFTSYTSPRKAKNVEEEEVVEEVTSDTSEHKEEEKIIAAQPIAAPLPEEIPQSNDILDEIEKQQQILATASEEVVEELAKPVDAAAAVIEEEESSKPTPTEQEEQTNKKRTYILISIIVLIALILAIIIGVFVARKEDSNEAVGIVDLLDVESPTISPTAPTGYCPSSTSLFELSSGSSSGIQQQGNDELTSSEFTWTLKDSCTNTMIMKCLPCSSNVGQQQQQDEENVVSTSLFTESTTLEPTLDPDIQINHEQCIGSTSRPRPVHNGERFRFNLLTISSAYNNKSGSCQNINKLSYEYGMFINVTDFSDCASKCVQDTPDELVSYGTLYGSFRGYEYNCLSKECRCLYDENTLNVDNSDNFDIVVGKYNTESGIFGSGEIDSVISKVGYYCGKLVSGGDDDDNYPTFSPRELQQGVYNYQLVEKYTPKLDGVSGCIPNNSNYVLEVTKSNYIGECCGFIPDSYVLRYDGTIVGNDEMTPIPKEGSKHYFPYYDVNNETCTQDVESSNQDWKLVMNINPSDGHDAGWLSEIWYKMESVGLKEESLSRDYKDYEAWRETFKCLAITRHNDDGIVDGVKVWEMDNALRFEDYFNPTVSVRQVVTSTGPVQRTIASEAMNVDTDPILASSGPNNNLAFNWIYSNNGVRVVLTDVGHHSKTLSADPSDDDDSHGLGNSFGTGSSSWSHDASVLQDDCAGTSCKVQGSDFGNAFNIPAPSIEDHFDNPLPKYGNYGFYISSLADDGACPIFRIAEGVPTLSPSHPLRDIIHKDDDDQYPCRESIESDMAGRVIGLTESFCGFCPWKRVDTNCYQRVATLVQNNDMTQVEARQSLLNKRQCTVPEDDATLLEEIKTQIEKIPYCGNVPGTPGSRPPTSQPTTTSPSTSPSKQPSKKPTNEPSKKPTKKPTPKVSMSHT